MNNKIISFSTKIILVLSLLSNQCLSQESESEPKIKYGILAQMHLSYAQNDSSENPYGFRLRRLDSKIWSSPTEYFEWSVILGFDNFFFRILEADVNFKLSDVIRLRIGQFAPPAVRSGAPVDNLFKVPIMTFIERPTTTLKWANNSALLAYRTFGAQVHGNFANNKMYYAFMVSNPIGSSYFYASSKNTVHVNAHNGLAYWGRLEYQVQENFVIGAFYGNGESKIDTINNIRSSYGAHILYRRNNVAFMSEIILGEYSYDNTIALTTTNYNGGYIECGYRIKSLEPAFRIDYYTPNKKHPDFFNVKRYCNYTLGLNYHATTKIKIQANYIIKRENMKPGYNQISNDLFYINLQCLL